MSRWNLPFSPQPRGKARNRKTEQNRQAARFRDQVWSRDQVGGWRGHESAYCARCGVLVGRGEGGQIDHIKPKSTHPHLRYEPSNGRVTCGPCNFWFKLNPTEREL